MRLEGRVAGPWASELDRVWVETASRLASRKLIIDLHNVTYADAAGKDVLRTIYAQTHADIYHQYPVGPIPRRRSQCNSKAAERRRGRLKDADDARNNDHFQKCRHSGPASSSRSFHRQL